MPDAIFDDECNIKTELKKLMNSLDARKLKL